MTLFELLHSHISKMVGSIGPHDTGNIHPLVMEEIERYIIQIVLEQTKYNLFATARILGIARTTLYRKIKKLAIDIPIKQNF